MPDHPFIPQPNGGPLGQAALLLNTGLQYADQHQRYKSEQERMQTEQDAGLLQKGLIRDADPNSPTYNKVKRDPNAEAAYQQDLQEKDAASPASGFLRTYYKNALRKTNPDLANSITDEMSGYQLKQYEKSLSGLLQKQATGNIQQQRFDETQNKNSVNAGHDFENDPILKLSKTSLNSLAKSQSILDNPNKPVTTKDLNLAYNDYINSVAAGGTATEGKIARELPETWAQEWNQLKARAGDFEDLRKSETGLKLINMLRENIKTVRNDMSSAIADQANNIYENYKGNTNPKVKETIKNKLKVYNPQKYAEIFGGEVGKQSFSSSLNGSGEGLIKPAAAPKGGPKPGDVEDGHRFKGGNPADPNNWEQVQ